MIIISHLHLHVQNIMKVVITKKVIICIIIFSLPIKHIVGVGPFITCFNLLSNCHDYCHIHNNQNHQIKSVHPSPLSPTDILPVKHIIGFGPFITCLNCHIHKNQNHRYLACQTYHWHWSCPACCNLPGSDPIG